MLTNFLRLPILILASTVDRNLVSADAIREKLNTLVYDVRMALLDPEVVGSYKEATRSMEIDFEGAESLDNEELFGGDFFESFAGQGRTHWHYGGMKQGLSFLQRKLNLRAVAHPILAGIESKFMASYGRDWLLHAHAARLAIVVGTRNVNGLKMFDPRMAWQITSSFIIVVGTVTGAFVLSCKLSATILRVFLIRLRRLHAHVGTWL